MPEALISDMSKKRVRVTEEQREYVKSEIMKNPLISDYTLSKRTGIKRGSIMNIRKTLDIDIDSVARKQFADFKEKTELAYDKINSDCLTQCVSECDKELVENMSNIMLAYGAELKKFLDSLHYYKVARNTYKSQLSN